jgi:DNA-binding NarL/FixJ family response regulator
MPPQIETLVIDDDVWSLRIMKGLLSECFPRMGGTVRDTPDPSGEFDIYFIDNEIEGRVMAAELAAAIRKDQPDALIIAYSGRLDGPTLKQLINAGCNGACDKSIPSDLAETMEITKAWIEQRLRQGREPVRGAGFVTAIRSMTDLLGEWNSRLDAEDRASYVAGGAA